MNIASELRQVLADDIVADDAQTLAEHSGDKWFAHEAPKVVVFARSSDDVRKLLQFANENKIPVTARGAGYGYVGSCVPIRRGIVLSLMQMNQIKEINFADAIALVEPGVITSELKRAARSKKLFYPPDPASFEHCTIGGNVATNAGGPRCSKFLRLDFCHLRSKSQTNLHSKQRDKTQGAHPFHLAMLTCSLISTARKKPWVRKCRRCVI